MEGVGRVEEGRNEKRRRTSVQRCGWTFGNFLKKKLIKGSRKVERMEGSDS